MMGKYQTDPACAVWSKTGKNSGVPTRSVNACRIGPLVCPVLTPHHCPAGSGSGEPSRIQFLSSFAPIPAFHGQAVDTVEWHVRSIRPIVLELTLLSSKVTVLLWPKQLGTMQATVFFTATGATFFSMFGIVTAAIAFAWTVTLSNSVPKILAQNPGAGVVGTT